MFPFFVLLGCSAQVQNSSELPESHVSVPMQRVLTDQETGLNQPLRLIIQDLEQWQSIWSEVMRDRYPITTPPAVDFGQSMVILAAMGVQNTGGHVISIEGVHRRGKRFFVTVRQVSPGPGCMTTQVLTSPVDIVQVPKSDEAVTFVERQETRNCD
jgi:hypothetical protein